MRYGCLNSTQVRVCLVRLCFCSLVNLNLVNTVVFDTRNRKMVCFSKSLVVKFMRGPGVYIRSSSLTVTSIKVSCSFDKSRVFRLRLSATPYDPTTEVSSAMLSGKIGESLCPRRRVPSECDVKERVGFRMSSEVSKRKILK